MKQREEKEKKREEKIQKRKRKRKRKRRFFSLPRLAAGRGRRRWRWRAARNGPSAPTCRPATSCSRRAVAWASRVRTMACSRAEAGIFLFFFLLLLVGKKKAKGEKMKKKKSLLSLSLSLSLSLETFPPKQNGDFIFFKPLSLRSDQRLRRPRRPVGGRGDHTPAHPGVGGRGQGQAGAVDVRGERFCFLSFV
jgi:hypothetical protein